MKQLIKQLLEAIGEDPSRDGLKKTPERVAEAYKELTAGYSQNLTDVINGAIFPAETDGMVIVKDIECYSLCEHHLLPFFGHAHFAYIPSGKIAGLSKLARALEIAARRPQVQERLTAQVADAIFAALDPKGVVVELQAEHLCMAMRGIQKPGSRIITTATRGRFEGSDLDGNGLLGLLRRT